MQDSQASLSGFAVTAKMLPQWSDFISWKKYDSLPWEATEELLEVTGEEPDLSSLHQRWMTNLYLLDLVCHDWLICT